MRVARVIVRVATSRGAERVTRAIAGGVRRPARRRGAARAAEVARDRVADERAQFLIGHDASTCGVAGVDVTRRRCR